MINTDNFVQLSGRLTRDAESIMDGRQVKFDIAIDRSGYEKGTDSNAGFFTCKMWLSESEYSAVASQKDVKDLFEKGLLTKGIPVRLVGALHHERWTDDSDKRRSNVVVMVESLTAYVSRSKSDDGEALPTASVRTATAASLTYDEPF